jgi:hypothetical protein
MKREIIKVSWDEISFMAMKLIYTVSNTLSLVNWVMKPPLRLTLVHSNLEVKPPSCFRFTGQKVALGLNLHPSKKKGMNFHGAGSLDRCTERPSYLMT